MTTVPPMPAVALSTISEVARRNGVSIAELCGHDRKRKFAWPRFEAMAAVRALRRDDGAPRFSLPQIGRFFGGRDHTSVIHGLERWAELSKSKEAA